MTSPRIAGYVFAVLPLILPPVIQNSAVLYTPPPCAAWFPVSSPPYSVSVPLFTMPPPLPVVLPPVMMPSPRIASVPLLIMTLPFAAAISMARLRVYPLRSSTTVLPAGTVSAEEAPPALTFFVSLITPPFSLAVASADQLVISAALLMVSPVFLLTMPVISPPLTVTSSSSYGRPVCPGSGTVSV